MMRNKILSLLVLAPLVVSCTYQPINNTSKGITKTITGTELKVDILWGYRIIAAYKDYLFLQENRDTSRLVVYKVEGDSLLYHKGLIDRGRGPKEFYYVDFSLGLDTLYVSNSDPTGLKAFYGIPLNNMDNIEDRDIWKAYSVPEMNIQTANYFVSLGSGQFLLAGGKANTEELFSILDFTDEELRSPVDFWPDDDTPGPLYAKQNVYMLCHLNSQRNRILYANTGGRYMFIASLQNRKLKEEVVIYSSLPKYEIGQDGNFHYTREGEHGIYSYTTHDRIYAQVGRTREEVRRKETYKNYPRTYFDELEVYDWDGNFIDNYQTDKPFFTFAISPDNKYLYTLSLDLETNLDVVMRYEL